MLIDFIVVVKYHSVRGKSTLLSRYRYSRGSLSISTARSSFPSLSRQRNQPLRLPSELILTHSSLISRTRILCSEGIRPSDRESSDGARRSCVNASRRSGQQNHGASHEEIRPAEIGPESTSLNPPFPPGIIIGNPEPVPPGTGYGNGMPSGRSRNGRSKGGKPCNVKHGNPFDTGSFIERDCFYLLTLLGKSRPEKQHPLPGTGPLGSRQDR